jgi:hypothetical protein
MAPDETAQPFVLEGVLTDLHYERGSANLLAQVDKHYKRNAVITGTGAVVGELFGQVANAAMLAMYDGEDTQNFICLIDDQVVCGQFAGAEHFKEGNKVKAVVSRKGDVLYMHAALEEARGFVWIHHPWGTRAEMWSNIRLGWWLFVFCMAMIALFAFLHGPVFGDTIWETLLFFSGINGGLCLFVGLWSIKDLRVIAGPTTEYFRLLGLARPETVNLNNFIARSVVRKECLAAKVPKPSEWAGFSPYEYRDVYSLKAAVTAGKVKMQT